MVTQLGWSLLWLNAAELCLWLSCKIGLLDKLPVSACYPSMWGMFEFDYTQLQSSWFQLCLSAHCRTAGKQGEAVLSLQAGLLLWTPEAVRHFSDLRKAWLLGESFQHAAAKQSKTNSYLPTSCWGREVKHKAAFYIRSAQARWGMRAENQGGKTLNRWQQKFTHGCDGGPSCWAARLLQEEGMRWKAAESLYGEGGTQEKIRLFQLHFLVWELR